MPSILLVDDDEITRERIRLALQDAGYEVREARNENEVLRQFQFFRTDLVITDIVMPEKDGLELIWQLTHECLDVLIIAMSEHSERLDYLAVARLFGAQRTLRKPFSVKELLHAVQDELRRHG